MGMILPPRLQRHSSNFAGLRAVSTRDDFILEESAASPGFFDLAGIKSPGLTSAPAIGALAVQLLRQKGVALEEKPAFRLIGKSIRCSDGEQYKKVPEFWSDCQKNGTFSKLVTLDNMAQAGLFGIFQYVKPGSSKEIEYSIMAASDGELPEGFREIWIPESVWAVFDCKGAVPQAIQNGWKYLEEEWLAKYPFPHASCPELEWYSSGNSYDRDYLSQIWIPVIDESL